MSSPLDASLFTYDQLDTLRVVLTTSSALSFLGNLFIVVSFLAFKSLRSNVTALLVFLLSVSDLVSSLTGFLVWFTDSTLICTIQAVFIQFWELSSILWSSCIAFHAYQAICRKKRGETLQTYIKFYCGVCYIVPGVLAVIPFLLDGAYGFAGVWCWITVEYRFVRFALYYMILLFLWVFNVIAYLFILKDMKKYMSFIIVSAHRRISMFILLFILCSMPGLVNRLLNIIYPNNPVFWLYVLQALVSPLQGLGNSFVYGNSKSLQYEYSELFRKSCGGDPSSRPYNVYDEDESANEYASFIGSSPRRSYNTDEQQNDSRVIP